MARIRIDLPDQFAFVTSIPIRVSDLNYGAHVGNDSVLSLIHEARVQFLGQLGYTEFQFAGVGLIMSDAGIEFKNELFYGDVVRISIACANYGKVNFDMFYKLEKGFINTNIDKPILVAAAKTSMVCYDYKNKKIIPIPDEALQKLRETISQ